MKVSSEREWVLILNVKFYIISYIFLIVFVRILPPVLRKKIGQEFTAISNRTHRTKRFAERKRNYEKPESNKSICQRLFSIAFHSGNCNDRGSSDGICTACHGTDRTDGRSCDRNDAGRIPIIRCFEHFFQRCHSRHHTGNTDCHQWGCEIRFFKDYSFNSGRLQCCWRTGHWKNTLSESGRM